MHAYQSWIRSLDELREQKQLKRSRRLISSAQTPLSTIDGEQMLSFSSNDYLGLAAHPDIAVAAKQAIDQFGFGAGASHVVVGHHDLHENLEEALARFVGRERALVFSSGYLANLAVLTSFADKETLLLQDKLNHASLIDGGRLSEAKMQRYVHADISSLSGYLDKYRDYQKRMVVTDGVFSMDGDVAPLAALSERCKDSNALFCVDDAHGLGVLGDQGRGSLSDAGMTSDDVQLLIGTFGKAFGTSGAFVAGPAYLIEHLMQTARPYIYTTATPPAIAAATLKSIELIRNGDERRKHLSKLISMFRSGLASIGLSSHDFETPIQPVFLGSNEEALRVELALKKDGIIVGAIRPPTVPLNTARLRVTLTASHTEAHVEQLLSSLKRVLSA